MRSGEERDPHYSSPRLLPTLHSIPFQKWRIVSCPNRPIVGSVALVSSSSERWLYKQGNYFILYGGLGVSKHTLLLGPDW